MILHDGLESPGKAQVWTFWSDGDIQLDWGGAFHPFFKSLLSNSLAGLLVANFDQQRALPAHQTRFWVPATLGCKSDHLWSPPSPRWISQLPSTLPRHLTFPTRGSRASPFHLATSCFSADEQCVANGDVIFRSTCAEYRYGRKQAVARRCACPIRSWYDHF